MIRIETDNTVKDGCRVRQLRACLKGRDMRERLYSPELLIHDWYMLDTERMTLQASCAPRTDILVRTIG